MRLCRSPSRLCVLFLAALIIVPAATIRPAAAEGEKALDEYFKGAVVGLEGKTVTLRYDFRAKEQADDFIDRVPFRIKPRTGQGIRWFDSKLEIEGNAGARHKAEWMGDVVVTATWIPYLEKDFGGFLSPSTETEDFATFTFVETYFHAFDKSAGGTNSIIKFGAQWRETDSEEYIGFRYGPRKPPKDDIKIGQPIQASFGRESGKLIFGLPEGELKGAEKGKKLNRFFVGFYAIKGRLLLDNIEIKGQLASDWMRRENVALKTTKPITAPGEGEIDEATLKLIAKHEAGEGRKVTQELLSIIKEGVAGEAVQGPVLAALKRGPKKTAQYAVELLYHATPGVREAGIEIIKAHLGKDYGYGAKTSEKKRSEAIQKLQADIEKNPGLLEGTTSE